MRIHFEKINDVFRSAENEGRNFLLEHEVYRILKQVGIKTPKFLFIKKGQTIKQEDLAPFKKSAVVVKVVNPFIVHKTDVGGIQFTERNAAKVNRTCKIMLETIPKKFQDWVKKFPEAKKGRRWTLQQIEQEIRGFLICEMVAYDKTGFGTELLMGLRHSREFGPIATIGVGGVEIEYLSERIKEGRAVSIGSPHILFKKDILRILEPLAIYDKLVGKVRGKDALITRDELVDTYFRFLQLGAYFSPYRFDHPYVIEEAEVNPFVAKNRKLIALDGMCRFSRKHLESRDKRYESIRYLVKPRTIGIIGVSEKMNMGHIILNNILKQGFPNWNVYVVKPGVDEIEGCVCVPRIQDLPRTVDLFVITVAAEQNYDVIKELVEHGKARSAIIIAGGLGEKKGTQALEDKIKELLHDGIEEHKLTPVVNGGNCLGIYSNPGKYDTTFVPDYKLPRISGRKTNLVYLSQSGAFMISRMSKLPNIEPLYAISIGNQIDLTVSDYLNYFKNDDEAKVFGVYVEGFLPADGLAFAEAACQIVRQEGKMVVLYKAGRTPEGRQATASHTASVAGDYSVAKAICEEAGVIVADSIFDFENYVKNLSFLADKIVRGNRIALISNAGFECVTMADNLKNDHEFVLATLSKKTKIKMAVLMEKLGIHRLQDVKNPMDTTPVADDAVFADCVKAMLDDENVDCAIVSPVPMTPSMQTLVPGRFHAENVYHPQSIAMRLIDVFHKTDKPFVINLDAGDIFKPMVDCLEQAGVPTFKRSDVAVKFLRKYINNRLKIRDQYGDE
ncbi:MAG: acetate--CoA ligase family protein [Candidatus Aminicenantes bacterium]|nr:MAG: acetate--CoA ligase family protein [Candidatus Aminicenantes bacterium]